MVEHRKIQLYWAPVMPVSAGSAGIRALITGFRFAHTLGVFLIGHVRFAFGYLRLSVFYHAHGSISSCLFRFPARLGAKHLGLIDDARRALSALGGRAGF